MNEIFNTREILGTLELPEGECELTARATAEYAEGSGSLVVRLDAAVRRREAHGGHEVAVKWLPKSETVTEFSSIEEAGEIARDIFRRWVRKVRASAPSLHQPSFS